MSDSSVAVLREEPQRFDVFLSHASEDKDDVARPLAEALRRHGLSVWYDEYAFRIGDNIIDTLTKGIESSRFGVLVLSNSFIGKPWTEYERKDSRVSGSHGRSSSAADLASSHL